jgi:hypothetical protein
VVQKQEIQVEFHPQPQPNLHVVAEYVLKNTGIRPLDSVDIRLPARRFKLANIAITSDAANLPQDISPANPRDTLIRFPAPWAIGETHTVRVIYDLQPASDQDGSLGFSTDAFELPAGGWTPSLPQARGVFGFGGVPPEKWNLVVRVPQDFLVHASHGKEKHSVKNSQVEFRFQQTPADLNPFLVAGRYRETRQDLPNNQGVHIWSRGEINADRLQQAGALLSKTLATFDSLFGSRGKASPPLWIVECPVPQNCFSQRGATYSSFLYGKATNSSAEMISRDTILIDPRVAQDDQREALAGPALAAGWLGYGQNPGFYEQRPPMSALPAFAAALAREKSAGPHVHSEIIRRALSQIPEHASPKSNDDPVISRAKGLLLFYALSDRVGSDNFQKAMQHMLSARQGRGFDITDLISAIEEQSHQTVGPFVRQWLKRPGVPADFRALYSQAAAQQLTTPQEATP